MEYPATEYFEMMETKTADPVSWLMRAAKTNPALAAVAQKNFPRRTAAGGSLGARMRNDPHMHEALAAHNEMRQEMPESYAGPITMPQHISGTVGSDLDTDMRANLGAGKNLHRQDDYPGDRPGLMVPEWTGGRFKNRTGDVVPVAKNEPNGYAIAQMEQHRRARTGPYTDTDKITNPNLRNLWGLLK